MVSSHVPVLCAVLALFVSLPGCGEAKPQVAEVTGIVTLDGKPLELVHVEFWPQVGPRSFGKTDDSGKFTLQTDDRTQVGCPLGTNKVSLRDTAHTKDDYIDQGGDWATHRDTNHSVIFLTGHDATGSMPISVNWEAVAKASPVIVMYMAVKHLGGIATVLQGGGRASNDPVTIISNASMPHQQVASTTLGEAGAFVASNDPPTPAIVVVGHAADWRSLLDWYKGPLRENSIG